MDLNTVNSFIKKLSSPQAAGDLNKFLEGMPQAAGQTALIAAGVAWISAGAFGLYTNIQLKTLTEMRAKLAETQALQPLVPRITDVPVSQEDVQKFADSMQASYPGLQIKTQGPAIYITSDSTTAFGQFREAVGHVQNGGSGWRVSVDRLCVGRECEQVKLGALLKINKVSVDK